MKEFCLPFEIPSELKIFLKNNAISFGDSDDNEEERINEDSTIEADKGDTVQLNR